LHIVGLLDEKSDGADVNDEEGVADGTDVIDDGFEEGATDGTDVNDEEGAADGTTDGTDVNDEEGAADGTDDSDADGTDDSDAGSWQSLQVFSQISETSFPWHPSPSPHGHFSRQRFDVNIAAHSQIDTVFSNAGTNTCLSLPVSKHCTSIGLQT